MAAPSGAQVVRLRSGDLVRLRPVRPEDRQALARAYTNLGEQSRYRRFFTAMPELSEQTLRAAVEVDHVNHEALVALPLLSREIVGECRYIRLSDRPDTADLAVTVVDAWQGRGLGSVLLARLSARALKAGIVYFSAEVLAENRSMLTLLPRLGRVESESSGTVVENRIKLADPSQQDQAVFLDLLAAAARGELVSIPAPLRQLLKAYGDFGEIVRLPVTLLLRALRSSLTSVDAAEPPTDEAVPQQGGSVDLAAEPDH
jgi:RimJ/RimL family protein N-acetyltransferase